MLMKYHTCSRYNQSLFFSSTIVSSVKYSANFLFSKKETNTFIFGMAVVLDSSIVYLPCWKWLFRIPYNFSICDFKRANRVFLIEASNTHRWWRKSHHNYQYPLYTIIYPYDCFLHFMGSARHMPLKLVEISYFKAFWSKAVSISKQKIVRNSLKFVIPNNCVIC